VEMRTVPLTQGHVALVDDEDYMLVSAYRWYYQKGVNTGYAARSINRGGVKKTVFMHCQMLGFPAGRVDHKDGSGLDNRRHNLRTATASQNGANRGVRRDSKTRVKGVALNPTSIKNPYVAYICAHGKKTHLGCFSTLVEAQAAYTAKAKEVYGEFANGGSLAGCQT